MTFPFSVKGVHFTSAIESLKLVSFTLEIKLFFFFQIKYGRKKRMQKTCKKVKQNMSITI